MSQEIHVRFCLSRSSDGPPGPAGSFLQRVPTYIMLKSVPLGIQSFRDWYVSTPFNMLPIFCFGGPFRYIRILHVVLESFVLQFVLRATRSTEM